MTAFRRSLRCLGAIALLSLPGLAAGEAQVTVLDGTPGDTLVRCELGGFSAEPVDIAGTPHLKLSVDDEGVIREIGAPELPRVCRSIIIPDDAAMTVRVHDVKYHDIPGVLIAPSRGAILRTQDPASVPYSFGREYARDAWFPAEVVTHRDPYVLRDVRGMVIEVNTFQYNPVTQVLRVYDEVTFSAVATGPGMVNVYDRALSPDRTVASFRQIQQHHFINAGQVDYTPLDEEGDMLIISYGNFMAAMQPFIDWKNSTGRDTTIVDVATIGNTFSAIKAHIQGVYNTSNLAFVLLVGDVAQIKSGSYAGGLSDPDYSRMDSDWYPDILVGRFSASTIAQVDTQVLRSVEYEQMDHSVGLGDWHARGMGIASNQGPGHFGEYDNQHMDLIRQDLLAYGFSLVDRIYDPSGTISQISNGLNSGRRAVHYCGHGSTTSWGTTGFSNTNVNALTNDNRLPFIHSVACVNGAFNSTCFGEAWLRATHGAEPTGAVGAYMSSINQYWDEPMYAQDETVDLFCAESYWSLGALWFAGSCHMMDVTGQWGRDMFQTWILFGDPSLHVHNPCAAPTNYCQAASNSTGQPASMGFTGTPSMGGNNFALTVASAPAGKSGLFFYGTSQASTPFGDGILCVGTPIQRLNPPIQTNGAGAASLTLNFNLPPLGSGANSVSVGDTVDFSFWFRDPPGGPSGFNFADGLEAVICP